MGKAALRVLLWTVAGTVLGCVGVLPLADLLERYPLINAMVFFPGSTLGKALLATGLAPHGEEGFIVILIAMVAQWTILGFLAGVYRQWWLGRVATGRRRSAESGQGAEWTPGGGPRLFEFVRAHKHWTAAAVVLLAAVGYCLWQEVLYARDREFFLRHVDHKAVAEACLEVLAKMANQTSFREQVGCFSGTDPRFPEAIRKLEPKAVAVHCDEVSITKTPRPFWNCLTLKRDRTQPTHYDLVYEEGCSYPRQTKLYSIDAK